MIIILTGVSGTGKTTIGQQLSKRLDWPFLDADDFHPEANIQKMASGHALTDTDRWPWLDRLRDELSRRIQQRQSAILACSALKQSYRKHLSTDPANIRFVHLQGDYALILARLQQRDKHFMPPELLTSQFDDLEECIHGLIVNIDQSTTQITTEIIVTLGLQNRRQTTTLADALMFPEAPRWHNGTLWFTDQHARKVIRMHPDGELHTMVETPDLPGGLGWLPDGTPLVVMMTQRRIFRIENGTLREYADLSQLASFHCNDMLVDAQGRCWVGNFGYDLHGGEAIKPAEIILIPPGQTARIVADDVIFPNGMAITPDNRTLIVAETFAARIRAFTISANGQLDKPTLWADLDDGFPDGLCLAQDGSLWVAIPNIGEVLQLEPSGKILTRITTRGRPYACMLDDDNRKIYITSSETDDPDEARRLRSGRIEVATIGEENI